MACLQIYGLIGYPVKHSLSAAMHNAAFRELKISAEYRLFEIPPRDLEDFLLNPDKKVTDINGNTVRAADIRGFNITIPHKVKAREILEKVKESKSGYVKLSGAVNTIKRNSDGSLDDYWNTDALGFNMALKEDLGLDENSLSRQKIIIVGCGGAGRAVVAGLSWGQGLEDIGIEKIYMYDNNKYALNSAREHFSSFLGLNQSKMDFIPNRDDLKQIIKNCKLLVNASPVGMKKGDPTVIDKELLHKDLYVYDVVYNRETQLIKDAKSKKLPAAGGLGMLLYQGAIAWRFWTGKDAPIEVMRRALKDALRGR